jgi:uncharacterized protein YegP (UPF0339 family)
MAEFEIYRGQNDDFYFQLIADNGEILLNSHGYESENRCEKIIEIVRSNSTNFANYECNITLNGQFYFNLLTTRGKLIAMSENFVTEQLRHDAIETVMETAQDAEIEELNLQDDAFSVLI